MVLKGPRFHGSPVRTYVVVRSLAGAVSLVVEASSPPPAWSLRMALLLIPRPGICTCSLESPPSAFSCLCQISFVAACKR